MKKRSVIIWVMAIGLVVTGVSKADVMGYTGTCTQFSVVYPTNLSTGEQIHPGLLTSIYQLDALEASTNGKLYALNVYGNFWEIDVIDWQTASLILIKDDIFQINAYFGQSLAFAPNGKLYATVEDPGDLFEIDVSTGDTTLVGSLSPFTAPMAFAINSQGRAVGWDEAAGWLFEVDLSDGSTTSIDPISGNFDAFDFGPDGTLYGWDHGDLYSIDLDNCNKTYINSFEHSGRSLTVIPEPATLLLLGLGAVMLRRKR